MGLCILKAIMKSKELWSQYVRASLLFHILPFLQIKQAEILQK